MTTETESAEQMVRPLLSSQQHMEEMIQDCGDGVLLPECCIYRVPITLSHLNEENYTPKHVSIGPFHYGNERLQDMQRHKQILFKRFTQRVGSSWDDLLPFVKHLVPKVRASYSEAINLTEHELAKLTLLDAGFIIELFFMYYEWHEIGNLAKFSQPWLRNSIRKDLLLLENQLPFFVIEELFNKALPRNHDSTSRPSFLELTYEYIGEYYNTQKLKPDPDVKIKHFTDLLRLFYVRGKMTQQGKITQQPFFSDEVASHILSYNVNELQEAGIKLKASESKCLLDLEFSGHTLEIPTIQVFDITKLLFGNMIALEQCHYPDDAYITDYVLVLDLLIDTSKDVDLLVHNKIIKNYLGDTKNIAFLFNSLSEHVVHSKFSSEYLDICKRLNHYCEDPWRKMKATLRRDYCNTPWQIVASIAASVLLFLTVVQTIFSILQVVK